MRFIFYYYIKDFCYFLRCVGYAIWYRELPNNTRNTDAGKPSIVAVQGVFSSWQALKNIIDALHAAGHRVFVIPSLGLNLLPIPRGARMVQECIKRYGLHEVVLLCWSKGGLIGKYAMLFHNQDGRIKKLVTLATPFAGSRIAHLVPGSIFDELEPESASIKELSEKRGVNGAIVSIFGVFDTAVFPLESCRLDGAKNIQVGSHGHFEILFRPEVRAQILTELSRSGQL